MFVRHMPVTKEKNPLWWGGGGGVSGQGGLGPSKILIFNIPLWKAH